MRNRRPANSTESDTRYCAVCLRAIPRTMRAVVMWCDEPADDPRPVLACGAKCERAERRAQTESEEHALDRDPGYHD